ncbi:MAG: nuclear transport factor 2 family protein [Bacteroidetes bacterium]|nr:nuclear transport factor 2 family protein [Bacteroidota bacterium]
MISKYILLIASFLLPNFAKAQTLDSFSDQELFKKISSLDSSLFATIYTCNPEKNAIFFSEDIEFYHDKGGLTKTRKALMDQLNKNFCDPNSEWQTHRKLVKGSMQIYRIKDYGVVQVGDHLFYETWIKDPNGKKEKLAGKAKFINLWQYKGGEFKLARVLSYDHQPAGN